MKVRITCDLCTAENNYVRPYCRQIDGDDWDELEDPCLECQHHCVKYVEIEK